MRQREKRDVHSAIFCGRVVKKAARQSLFIADRNLRFNRFEHSNGASSAPPNTIVAGIDRFQFDDSCAARLAPSINVADVAIRVSITINSIQQSKEPLCHPVQTGSNSFCSSLRSFVAARAQMRKD
jgi:hypothetical protein